MPRGVLFTKVLLLTSGLLLSLSLLASENDVENNTATPVGDRTRAISLQ